MLAAALLRLSARWRDGGSSQARAIESDNLTETLDAASSARHPWRCKLGHENRTLIPPEAREGPRRRLVLWCSVPGCMETAAVFAGSVKTVLLQAGAPKRRPRKDKPTQKP